MKNARRYDDRITIGVVPDHDDLVQLRELGYRTLIDLRDEMEKFGGLVETKAKKLGIAYVSVPVARDELSAEAVVRFYRVLFEEAEQPVYAFSRFGKKPLAFLLLLDAVAKGDSVIRIFQRASTFGIPLEGDLCLQAFIVGLINSGPIEAIQDAARKYRPTLPEKAPDEKG